MCFGDELLPSVKNLDSIATAERITLLKHLVATAQKRCNAKRVQPFSVWLVHLNGCNDSAQVWCW